jgi:hypothetical protein
MRKCFNVKLKKANKEEVNKGKEEKRRNVTNKKESCSSGL